MGEKLFEEVRERQKKRLYVRYSLFGIIIVATLIISIFYFYDFNDEETIPTQSSDVQGVSAVDKNIDMDNGLICVSSTIDPKLTEQLQALQEEEILVTEALNCTVHLTQNFTNSNEYEHLWSNLYVPVVRVDSSIDDLSKDEVYQGIRSKTVDGKLFIWSDEDTQYINRISSSELDSVYANYDQVKEMLYSSKEIVAIIPFFEVTPKMKIVGVDGNYPYDNEFDIYNYPLAQIIWISSYNFDSIIRTEALEKVQNYATEKQFDPEKIGTFILTGHSAVGARQYIDKEINPASSLSELFSSADLVHVSNESSFSESCVQSDNSRIICGTPERIVWLNDLSVDLVSLTGSGILDYGREEFEKSLDIYKENGVDYFAGGLNREEARKPHTENINSTDLSFFGYSIVTPTRYLAQTNASGNTAPDKNRDGDALILIEALANDRNNSDLQVVEFQWGNEFDIELSIGEQDYADIAAANGADIIFGTSSHIPKQIKYKDQSVIFYGLGDLLYYHSADIPHEGIIIENIVYDGKYIGFKIHPITINKNLQVKLADVDKSNKILNTVFSNSFD